MTDQDLHRDSLLESYSEIGGINHIDGANLPNRDSIIAILAHLKQLLFPGYFQTISVHHSELDTFVMAHLEEVKVSLSQEIMKSLLNQSKGKADVGLREESTRITDIFLSTLSGLRAILKKDITAIYNGDPAAKSEDEIILAYPGFIAITVYRLAHELHKLKVPLIPRIMTELAHMETGIDIHPAAKIGDYFCIDHGSSLVIGETSVIGNHVKLYQGVTLGALSVKGRDTTGVRHPKLEDHVTVYARTTILGGDTVIGAHSIIGGNVWLTSSVPPHSKIYLTPNLEQVHQHRDELSSEGA